MAGHTRKANKRKSDDDSFLNESVIDQFSSGTSTPNDSFLNDSVLDLIATPATDRKSVFVDHTDAANDFLYESLSDKLTGGTKEQPDGPPTTPWIKRRRRVTTTNTGGTQLSERTSVITTKNSIGTKCGFNDARSTNCKDSGDCHDFAKQNCSKKKINLVGKPSKVDGIDKDKERCGMVERLKAELEPHMSHIRQVVEGKKLSERAQLYNQSGKQKHALKYNLNTGGFTEDEFFVIMDILQKQFLGTSLHFLTDVVWPEVALKLLMKRQHIQKNNATNILCNPGLSSDEEEELKRYKQAKKEADSRAWEKYKNIVSKPDPIPKLRPPRLATFSPLLPPVPSKKRPATNTKSLTKGHIPCSTSNSSQSSNRGPTRSKPSKR